MLLNEIGQFERRWPKMTVPNPQVSSAYQFLNYKKPFNVFKERDLFHYYEAYDDVSAFKRDETQPYEYLYNPFTGRVARRVVGQGGNWMTIETSEEKAGVDGRVSLPTGKPRDTAHAWAVITQDYDKIKRKGSK